MGSAALWALLLLAWLHSPACCWCRLLHATLSPDSPPSTQPLDPSRQARSQDWPLDSEALVRAPPPAAAVACSQRFPLAPGPFVAAPAPHLPRPRWHLCQQRRKVSGYQPEGVHLTHWGEGAVLVSWQSGEPAIDWSGGSLPRSPHDPVVQRGSVKYGTSSSSYPLVASEPQATTYSYRAQNSKEGYQSPLLHHVVIKGLTPGQRYFYFVGSDSGGWGSERNFTALRSASSSSLPLRIGAAWVGQTPDSSDTLSHIMGSNADVLLMVGDFSYADDEGGDQRRWDGWARLTEPLLARTPLLHTAGNHEQEEGTDGAMYTAYNARYPLPTDPSGRVSTAPNYLRNFLERPKKTPANKFVDRETAPQNNSYYSVDLPGAHIISLHSYLPFGVGSTQYNWLKADLAHVDRSKTPWVLAMTHTSLYHTYTSHFKENEAFRELFEPMFMQYGVDMVFAGHTHAYERTRPMFNYSSSECGPVYFTVGAGGNFEGLAYNFVDTKPPSFCKDTMNFGLPNWQPSPDGQAHLSWQDGKFCLTTQPEWSAVRDPSFGHGVLTVQDADTALWEWHPNQGGGSAPAADSVAIKRSKGCGRSAAGAG